MVRRLRGRVVWGALVICAFLVLPPLTTAGAAPVSSSARVTAFPQPDLPPTGGNGPLIVGPDGTTWFSGYEAAVYTPGEEPHYLPRIMRINSLGQVGTVVEHNRAEGFALGPDGNVWTTETRWIDRITPSGEITYFPLPVEEVGQHFTQAAGPIITGSDGNLWFSGYRAISVGGEAKSVATIDRMTLAGEITQFQLPGPGSFPTRLTLGPEGNVWFTEMQENKVGRITPAGAIQMVQLPSGARPLEIVLGADGDLWVTEDNDDPRALGRITPNGAYTQFPLPPGISAGALTAGPDGRLWFASGPGTIARITPSGRVSRIELPQATSVADIVAGAEGKVWYTASPEPPCAPRDSACGQGGNYESGIVGMVEPVPLALTIESGRPAAKGHRAKVRISCHDGNAAAVCRGRLRLRAGGKVVAQRRFRLGTDLSRSLSLRLDRDGREKLARRGHLRVVCVASVAGVGSVTRRLNLKLSH